MIRVSDLRIAARLYTGGSLARGRLDARMDELGWERVRLDGHALEGRAGRAGPHARADVYRGHLPISAEGMRDHVTTVFPYGVRARLRASVRQAV